MTTIELLAFEPMDPSFLPHQYEIYKRLREEAPVYRCASGMTVLSRYDDVKAVTADNRRFSNELSQDLAAGLPTNFEDDPALVTRIRDIAADMPVDIEELMSARHMPASDPPQHNRLRSIANRAFTPRRVGEMVASLEAAVAEFVSPIEHSERFEIVSQLARPYPIRVIGDVLGMPRADHDLIGQWTDDFTAAQYSQFSGSEHAIAEVLEVYRRVSRYFAPRIAETREADQTLISIISKSRTEENLSHTEALMFLFAVMGAGNDTTRQLIEHAILELLRHPEQLSMVKKNPDLIPAVIEEALRYGCPIRIGMRLPTEDVEIAGATILAGTPVITLIGAANRDPTQFVEPERFDITREPNQHLSLGHGPHYCLGAHLARLEGQTVLASVIQHLDKFTLANEPEALDSWMMNGYKSIELVRR